MIASACSRSPVTTIAARPNSGVVRERDDLVLGREGLHREHRAEDLLRDDLAAGLGVDQERRAGSTGRRDRSLGSPPSRSAAPSAIGPLDEAARRDRSGAGAPAGRCRSPRRAGHPGAGRRAFAEPLRRSHRRCRRATSMRVPARQTWPGVVVLLDREGCRELEVGVVEHDAAGDLPPSSKLHGVRLSAAARAMSFAVGTDPVNEMPADAGMRDQRRRPPPRRSPARR